MNCGTPADDCRLAYRGELLRLDDVLGEPAAGLANDPRALPRAGLDAVEHSCSLNHSLINGLGKYKIRQSPTRHGGNAAVRQRIEAVLGCSQEEAVGQFLQTQRGIGNLRVRQVKVEAADNGAQLRVGRQLHKVVVTLDPRHVVTKEHLCAKSCAKGKQNCYS
jgi:hypothetical protein